jgi:DNA-3-methyladenine glycosylase II
MRATLAQHAGTVPDVAGCQVTCLPPPACLTDPGPVPGLGPVRRTRLVAVARAALDGKPDTAEPAALPPEQARQRLEQLPGIGPFSSAIVVVRALRHTDYLAGLKVRSVQHELSSGPPVWMGAQEDQLCQRPQTCSGPG